MPELPEVETTRRGISPYLLHKTITAVVVRQPRLRWPVSRGIRTELPGQIILEVGRRGKYLLLKTSVGTAIIHLGMSGSLGLTSINTPAGAHDHVEFEIDKQHILRLRDPRRFGCVLWTRREPLHHPLLRQLGPEPLGPDFGGAYLYQTSRGRRTAIKNLLMDSHRVVGIGNIYASEALFHAGIHPARAAGRIALARYHRLAGAICTTLSAAIQAGGTTLRDFRNSSGRPGYFAQSLSVYARANQPCLRCGGAIRKATIGQRASYWCAHCQH